MANQTEIVLRFHGGMEITRDILTYLLDVLQDIPGAGFVSYASSPDINLFMVYPKHEEKVRARVRKGR